METRSTQPRLMIGDNGDLNMPRPTSSLSRSRVALIAASHRHAAWSAYKVPALTALREWYAMPCARRTLPSPVCPMPLVVNIASGRTLFTQAGCSSCHGGDIGLPA